MKTYERFLNYVRIHTASSEDSSSVPTTERQFDLANPLVKELHAIGVENARVNDKCYVYASVAATPGCESCPAIGFIAHMDTVPDFSGENVQPRIIENYDGGDVVLGTSGRVLSPEKLPHLPSLKGKTLIVTDGTTVLGGDDKAGIAEIMTAIERVISENRPHGKLCIGFTPDEEVGSGADNFNVAEFGADFAYTVDGGAEGEIEYENFNAASAKVEVRGVSVHPGYAKGKMINAARVAAEFAAEMPVTETPEQTVEYEGFYHLLGIEGNVEHATLSYIIRDHDRQRFEQRKAFVQKAAEWLNERYGQGTVTVTINDQYYNMREKIEPVPHVVNIVLDAMKACHIPSRVRAIRGGTDGAQLSFMGLPCPNIFAGGLNFHGPHEFLPIPSMQKASELVVKIVELTAQM